jgi:hypothetical protein
MIVVPRQEVGYQQVDFFIYLTNVTLEDGATRRRRSSTASSLPPTVLPHLVLRMMHHRPRRPVDTLPTCRRDNSPPLP